MSRRRRAKRYDLEDRTYAFAKRVARLTKKLPKDVTNLEFIKQLVRAAGSVGANYIEANEALSRKDFLYRIKVCRKEAKESRYWLRLIETKHDGQEKERKALEQETTELMNIFGSIWRKSE